MVGAAALNASIEMFLKIRQVHGEDAIQNRVTELAGNLAASLSSIGAVPRLPKAMQCRSGILTFSLPGVEPNEIRKCAADADVVVSCRDGGVRASIHAYNNADDLDRLIEVLKAI